MAVSSAFDPSCPTRIPTTSTNSPRLGIVPSAAAAANSPSGPRTICSWTLVSSRQTAPGRPAPQAAARSRSVAATRPGRLEQHGPAVVGGDRGDSVLSLSPRTRQEPLERPARAGHPRCGHRGKHGRSAGDRHDPAPLPRPGRHEVGAGIADDRCAGIGDERQVRAVAQVIQERSEPARPAPRMKAGHPPRQPVPVQQSLAQPRVFGGDQGYRGQDLERAQRDIRQVPDRRGHDVQHAATRWAAAIRWSAVTRCAAVTRWDITSARRGAGRAGAPAHSRAEPGRRRGYR